MDCGLWPAAKGLPATGVSAPVFASMTYAETVLSAGFSFVTYRNFPLGSVVTEEGFMPVAKGLPATAVSAPVFALMV